MIETPFLYNVMSCDNIRPIMILIMGILGSQWILRCFWC